MKEEGERGKREGATPYGENPVEPDPDSDWEKTRPSKAVDTTGYRRLTAGTHDGWQI